MTGWNPDADGEVNAVAVAGSTVYVGGNFYCVNLARPVLGGGLGCATSTDGTARASAAAFDAGTGAVTGWNPDVDGEVFAVAVSGSTVYVGGNFDCVNRDRLVLGGGSGCATSTNGTTRNFAAAFAADTARVTQWDPDVDTSLAGGVRALALGPSGVYLGGHFGAVNGGGALRANLAEVDSVTGAATAWNPGIGNPSSGDDVKAIATGGSTVYVGGDFTCIGGPPPCTGAGKTLRRNLTALSMVTGGALPWDPSPDDVVLALTASPAAIFAGGAFEAADGSTNWRRYAKLVAVPVPPANVTATAGDGRATVSWTASAGAASYAVTASPGGATCTATGTSCTVTGLTNGTSYTFTVTATNAAGTSDSSAASTAVAPTAASPVPSPTPTSDPAPTPVPARMAASSSAALPLALVRRGLRADASGSVALRIGCTSTSSRCVASGALAGLDGAVLGRFGGVWIAAGEERGVVVRLAARPYARLREGGAARVRVTVWTVNRQVGGRTHTATQRVWLHLPPSPRPEPVTG